MDGEMIGKPVTDAAEVTLDSMGDHAREHAAPERATDSAIGQRIRLLREHRHMTQAQLARAIGVSYQQVYKYERGIDRLSIGRLVMIAEALSISPLDLLDGLPQAEAASGSQGRIPVIERIRLLEAYADIPDADVRQRV